MNSTRTLGDISPDVMGNEKQVHASGILVDKLRLRFQEIAWKYTHQHARRKQLIMIETFSYMIFVNISMSITLLSTMSADDCIY